MKTYYFNPSSGYEHGEYVRNEIEKSRKIIADFIGAKQHEIFFTSGGTESDNWVLKGFLKKGDHLITSSIEHKAILNTCKELEEQGVEVTYLNVDHNSGEISISNLENSIKPNTKLISIMTINNEIGVLQNIGKIADVAKKYNIKFHTDAVQAFGKFAIDVNKYKIDMMSGSSHKINGLKGTGFLYIRDEYIDEMKPLICGGEQEFSKRGGTENVIGILGLGKAVEIIGDNRNIVDRWNHVNHLYDYFIENLLDNNKNFVSYGKGNDYKRYQGFVIKSNTPYVINMCFPDCRGETIVRLLDANGICVSTGSACNTHSNEPSHVLKAVGLTDDEANSSVRFSLSYSNTEEEMKYASKILKNVILQLKR